MGKELIHCALSPILDLLLLYPWPTDSTCQCTASKMVLHQHSTKTIKKACRDSCFLLCVKTEYSNGRYKAPTQQKTRKRLSLINERFICFLFSVFFAFVFFFALKGSKLITDYWPCKEIWRSVIQMCFFTKVGTWLGKCLLCSPLSIKSQARCSAGCGDMHMYSSHYEDNFYRSAVSTLVGGKSFSKWWIHCFTSCNRILVHRDRNKETFANRSFFCVTEIHWRCNVILEVYGTS